MTTATEIWTIPAGAVAALLTRQGGLCRIEDRRPLYDVELSDGRLFRSCGLEGDPEPERALGRSIAVVLCAVPGAEYSLVSSSTVASCRRVPS